MGNAPDLQEAIKRFNHGCAAFERALAAARAVDLARYEAESRTTFVDVVGALEWAVKHCLEQFYAQTMTEEELAKADQQTFEKLLKMLARKAHPPLNNENTRALHAARRQRNRIQHEAALAPHEELQKAFRVVRRFLSDYLPALEEQLATPALDAHSESEAPPAQEQVPVLRPAHRHEGGDAWIARIFQGGFQKLRQGRAQHYDATIASLELEAEESLTQHALELLETNRSTSDQLTRLSEYTEAEAKELLLRGGGKGMTPEDAERLRRLLPLINRYPALCLEAGWLCQEEGLGLRFKDTCLPSLLVGRHLARSGAQTSYLRQQVGKERSWREAAWMAISSGDELSSWTGLLLAERDPLLLLERVVVTCAAFGAVLPGTAASHEMAKAFHLCVSALVAFAPRWVEGDTSEQPPTWMQGLRRRTEHDPDSPWFLPAELWRQCVLDLADASWILGNSFSSPSREPWPSAPSPLAELLSSLGLPARLSPEESSALASLCAPNLAARDGLLGVPFFKQVFLGRTRVGALVNEPFLEAWILRHGIRALREANRPETLRSLAIPGDGQPAGYLLNRAGLILEWYAAWMQLTATPQPEDAVQGWVEAVSRLSSLDDSSPSLRRLLLEECLMRLSDLGLRSQALVALREACVSQIYPADAEGEQYETQVAILRLLELTESGWSQHIAAWTKKPALAWRTLLAAGAPQADIARWCIHKMLQREQAPEAYRSGPVGVLTHHFQALSTGPWQLAFQQAQEALTWILEEGDASAISVLAAASLSPASSPEHFDPPMGKLETNLSFRLSMVLWPRVIHRPAGREAFYAHIERGAFPGEMFFFGSGPLPDDEPELWLRVAVQLWKPRMLAMTQGSPPLVPMDAGAEARRLLACFEQRMNTLWVTESQWPQMKAHFERLGWSPPSSFPSKVAMEGDPWERPWLNAEVQAVVLACSAAHGVDVAAPLARLFRWLRLLPASRSTQLSLVLGHAVSRLSQYLPERASEVLEEALAPEILSLMCNDQTSDFWSALLKKHGSTRVLAMLDPLKPVDCGLGLVDALKRLDIETLRQRELRPELLRPLLIRASQGRYVPSARFWEEAWKVARSPTEIPEFPQLAPGPWLEELLTQSRNWEPGHREQLLRHLAGFSVHEEVRRRCLATLLA